ncbi:hypothetical protein ACOSQ2_018636 [Xanthoceras sorbifolium]
MFCSEVWEQCKWSTFTKGKAAFATVMSMSFWNGVTTCLKVFAPLVEVLRLVDGDRKPAMGFVYGELLLAKEEIKKRNRLDVSRLNNLVYVQFNAKLSNKQKRAKEKDLDVILAKDRLAHFITLIVCNKLILNIYCL